MNICYIADSQIPSRTANSIHVMQMCHAYGHLNHRVTLLTPRWREGIENDVEDIYKFYGVEHTFDALTVPFRNLFFDTVYHGALLPLLALSKRPDLVHSRNLATAWGATQLFKIPTIYEMHGLPPQNKRQHAYFQQMIQSKHLLAIVVITNALAERVKPFFPKSFRLIVAPDGVNERWLQNKSSRKEARAQLGLCQEERSIAVYTGHLYPGRGIELIMELARRQSNYLFIVVGGREEDVMKYRELSENIINLQFTGFRPPAEMMLYLHAADVLLMPYANRVETVGGVDSSAVASPMKMFEYMAAGRPIIASTLPVLQEVLQHEVNALLLPYSEPEKWCNALQHLKYNPSFACELGTQARHDVGQYTWTNRAKYILKEINSNNARAVFN